MNNIMFLELAEKELPVNINETKYYYGINYQDHVLMEVYKGVKSFKIAFRKRYCDKSLLERSVDRSDRRRTKNMILHREDLSQSDVCCLLNYLQRHIDDLDNNKEYCK